jgi:hypothetical protein
MPIPQEQDYPPGHPKRADYNPASPEAIEWARLNVHPLGERDWPVDHPKAVDTPGNLNAVVWQAGVDPFHPDREPFSGHKIPADKEAGAAAHAPAAGEKPSAPASPFEEALTAAEAALKAIEAKL